jgi:hypothetical protein
MVVWVNDEQGECLYQFAYDHVEIWEERASEVTGAKHQIGQSVPLLHDQFSQAFWQHIRKEREWRHRFQSPLPLSLPWR